ncbi:hypothetical protein DL764_006976 [Monosporascus ibericus]|uniref:NAD(P)-binding domain-containing protein n=1 Tax=Monosporascus ibericus TaxID=155417 RepID=A0A4Q4T3C6_9PEZI|nr:hypothetical protein DL764_006976 [Monosporascus ibericus]
MAPSSLPTTNTTTTPGAVLLTGGTGKVASRIAPLLQAAGIPAIIASRSGHAPPGPGYTGVRFDWHDRATWEPALPASTQKHGGLSAVFLVMPGMPDPGPAAAAFADLARARAGAKRFVLLSASSLEEGGPAMGQVHLLLRERGERGEIGWAAVRPTWMQENFVTQETHLKSIKEENKVYSATGVGKIPWVSAGDVAAVAFAALTAPEPPNRDFLVLGPELLSYGDVAGTLTEVLGREIAHGDLSEAELARRHQGFGMPAQYAAILAAMDTTIKNGSEDRLSDVVLQVTGRPPRRFRDLVEENKAVWDPPLDLELVRKGWYDKGPNGAFPERERDREQREVRAQDAFKLLYSVSESVAGDDHIVVVTCGVLVKVMVRDEESVSRRILWSNAAYRSLLVL